MKMIVAVIQPEKLDDVKQALFDIGIQKMTVSRVRGCGQQGGFEESYRGQVRKVNLLDKVRIEIALNQQYVDSAIQAIIKSAKTDNIGDGKIFVTDVSEVIRIRTGEKGDDAV